MSLSDVLKKEVSEILKEQWECREGKAIPSDNSLKLSNDGMKLSATVLYADLADSTLMVDQQSSLFSAKIYKIFLKCVCKIINANSGVSTAFDGDRVMGVFIGDYKNTNAVKSALRINHAVTNIINPALKNRYSNLEFSLAHGVGIDTIELLVARAGIRGSNDLVWVGSAANYAAKLATLRQNKYCSWITQAVFDKVNEEVKYNSKKELMWEKRIWEEYNKIVYTSLYFQSF